MAHATYKIEPGPKGGFIAYVQVISPLLKDKSGKWFVVSPDRTPPLPKGELYEYSSLWLAEKAARDKALGLAGKVNEMEKPPKPFGATPSPPKRRRRR